MTTLMTTGYSLCKCPSGHPSRYLTLCGIFPPQAVLYETDDSGLDSGLDSSSTLQVRAIQAA